MNFSTLEMVVFFLSPLLFFLRFLSSLQIIVDFDSGACLLSRVIRVSPSCHMVVSGSHAEHDICKRVSSLLLIDQHDIL